MSKISKIPRAWLGTVAAVLAMLLISPFLLSGMVRLATADAICEPEALTEEYEVILVLGCGIKENGEPSDMLEDRLKTGMPCTVQVPLPRSYLAGIMNTMTTMRSP